MKISLNAAMRARDVSRPTATDDIEAARLADGAGPPPASGRSRPHGATASHRGQRASGRPRTPSLPPDGRAAR